MLNVLAVEFEYPPQRYLPRTESLLGPSMYPPVWSCRHHEHERRLQKFLCRLQCLEVLCEDERETWCLKRDRKWCTNDGRGGGKCNEAVKKITKSAEKSAR